MRGPKFNICSLRSDTGSNTGHIRCVKEVINTKWKRTTFGFVRLTIYDDDYIDRKYIKTLISEDFPCLAFQNLQKLL